MKTNCTIILALCLVSVFLSSCRSITPDVLKDQELLRYSRSWEKLDSYPMKIGRTDDLHFFTPDRGFVINSEGKLFLTEDGGQTWTLKFEKEETFFRCITFSDSLNGWLGTLGTGDKSLYSKDPIILYETHDGGETWAPTEFDGPYPGGLCGLQVISKDVIVGCGRVRGPSYFIKTIDGGKTWKSYDLNHLAGSLIAPHFYDEQHGMLIGGTTTDKIKCRSLILETFDGGTTWDTMYISKQTGEYCWKTSFPNEQRGFISIQRNDREGYTYCLQTEDGGKNWFENVFIKGYYYVQGVGFLNENLGWLGGSTGFTMETRDGGKSWNRMADIGRGFNKFQFFGDSLAYGTGFGVYKLQNPKPLPNGEQTDYYENGKIKSAVHFKDGMHDGSAKHYHKNGNRKAIGNLKNNLRIGTWTFFDESDKKTYSTKFKNGVAQISNKSFKDFVGKYKVNESTERIISFKKGHLYSKLSTNDRSFKLYPISKTTFLYEHDANTIIEFVRNNTGKVTHHIMTQRRRESRADKMAK